MPIIKIYPCGQASDSAETNHYKADSGECVEEVPSSLLMDGECDVISMPGRFH